MAEELAAKYAHGSIRCPVRIGPARKRCRLASVYLICIRAALIGSLNGQNLAESNITWRYTQRSRAQTQWSPNAPNTSVHLRAALGAAQAAVAIAGGGNGPPSAASPRRRPDLLRPHSVEYRAQAPATGRISTT